MLSTKGLRDRKAARGKVPAVKKALRTLVSGDWQVQARYGFVCITFDSVQAADQFVRNATAADEVVARLRADARGALEVGESADPESRYALAVLRACGVPPVAEPSAVDPAKEGVDDPAELRVVADASGAQKTGGS